MRVVLATANMGKLREMQVLLAPSAIVLESQAALGIAAAPETGATFLDNALIKARHAARASGLPAIADDSGIEVDVLGGAPGIYSARYAGAAASDAMNLQKLLAAVAAYPAHARTARYRCSIVLLRGPDDSAPLIGSGTWEGRLIEQPRGANGFGYDPIFEIPGLGLTAAEIDPVLKNALSHRGQALRALLAQLAAAGIS